MYFEGPEKKLEIVIDAKNSSLRSMGYSFYEALVEKAGAKIISEISSESCDAYLLSESSLFVWDHRLTMITCGATTLSAVAIHLVQVLGAENILSFIYERKNEYCPERQVSDFYQDLELFKKHISIPGRVFCFGDTGGNHMLLYHWDKPYVPNATDQTLEVLMYGLQGSVLELFTTPGTQVADVRHFLQFSKALEGFQWNDHMFNPYGYSLNAIRGSDYFTIHVTPEKNFPYVSFEASISDLENPQMLVEEAVGMFQPHCFDVITISPKGVDETQSPKGVDETQSPKGVDETQSPKGVDETQSVPNYVRDSTVRESLSCGYFVRFNHHHRALQSDCHHHREPQSDCHYQREPQSPRNFAEEGWVTERHPENFKISFAVEEHLYSKQSLYQKVDVVQTKGHGKMLLNDELVMLSERDEFAYHDMITHVPLFTHANPKNVLVIGGGDGGTAREVLRHPDIERCVMVEIDAVVVEACKQHIPVTAQSFENPKLELHIADAVEYVKTTKEKFDVILVDSTDPIGPAKPLFGAEFYQNVFNCLTEDGIVVSQGESPYYNMTTQCSLMEVIGLFFPLLTVYNFSNLTYPGGLWSFTFGSKKYHPIKDFNPENIVRSGLKFSYYNSGIHTAAFCLPEFERTNLQPWIKGF